MKVTRSLIIATITIVCGLSMVPASANDEAVDITPEESPMRQLVRGRSNILADAEQGDANVENEEDADRELRRNRRRGFNGGNGDSNGNSGSKGSKSGGSKGSKGGSKGSKGGSKGSKGSSPSSPSGGFGGIDTCGAGCGDKDFAYIHLEGDYFFGILNDNSTGGVPIETVGSLNATKPGSTLRIFEDDLHGTVEYFDHYDDHPYKYDITGVITGACTILDFFPVKVGGVKVAETCVAHCTICVTYQGECCDKPDYAYEGWRDRELWEPIYNCTTFGGFATTTADLFFDLALNELGQLIAWEDGGLINARGLGAVTGTAGDLGPSRNGGLSFIDYEATNNAGIADPFKVGLKIPFSDAASCKLQDYAADYMGF